MSAAHQSSRVEAWLRDHGSTTIADWDRQPACDGGDKITRLAARINDLRAAGLNVTSRMVPLGNTRVALYELAAPSSQDLPVGSLSSPRQAAASILPLSLGQPSVSARNAIDDDPDYQEAA